jgi:hypothetical protein
VTKDKCQRTRDIDRAQRCPERARKKRTLALDRGEFPFEQAAGTHLEGLNPSPSSQALGLFGRKKEKTNVLTQRLVFARARSLSLWCTNVLKNVLHYLRIRKICKDEIVPLPHETYAALRILCRCIVRGLRL